MKLRDWLEELRRRRVVRAAIGYAAVLFVVLQVADIVVPALGLPDAVVTGLIVVGALGFPIAMALAWSIDLTPAGLERTAHPATATGAPVGASDAPAARSLGSALALAGAVVVVAGTLWWVARPDVDERAVELDSLFALGWAGVTDGYTIGVGYDALSMPRQDAVRRGEAAIDRALALEPGLVDAIAARGAFRLYLKQDHRGAVDDLSRVVELSPSHAQAHDWLGDGLAASGRTSEAVRHFRRAVELDPLSALMHREEALRRLDALGEAAPGE